MESATRETRGGTIHKTEGCKYSLRMNDILTAATPAMTIMLGANSEQIAAIGKKAVLLLGFSAALQNPARKPDEHKRWLDHRPPPRWGINE